MGLQHLFFKLMCHMLYVRQRRCCWSSKSPPPYKLYETPRILYHMSFARDEDADDSYSETICIIERRVYTLNHQVPPREFQLRTQHKQKCMFMYM
jgi:hypothetical protein